MPTAQLQALAWALPTVIVLAALIVFVAKKLLPVLGAAPSAPQLMTSTTHVLSDTARVHLLRVEGKRFLIVEADGPMSVEAVDGSANRYQPATLFRSRS